jgi:hypothetical protein
MTNVQLIDELTKPLISIEDRAPKEVFDIMVHRIRVTLAAHKPDESMRESLEAIRGMVAHCAGKPNLGGDVFKIADAELAPQG